MRLFGTIFTQQINAEPLVPTNYVVSWPDGALTQIGVVGSHFYLSVDTNADSLLTKIRLDLVRNADGHVIHTMVFTKGIEGWGTAPGGGILGVASQLETVLPVAPGSTAPHWQVTQAGGLTVRLTPSTPGGSAFAFSALIVMHLQYIQLTSTGAVQIAGPYAVELVDVQGVNKEIIALKNDGTIWRCVDITLATPVWTQITNP